MVLQVQEGPLAMELQELGVSNSCSLASGLLALVVAVPWKQVAPQLLVLGQEAQWVQVRQHLLDLVRTQTQVRPAPRQSLQVELRHCSQ